MGSQLSKFDKGKESWNKIKSKGKKRFILNILFVYLVAALLFPTIQIFVLKKIKTFNRDMVTLYLMSLVTWSLMGLWIGNMSWKASMKKFEK
ncbi:hypothetical protein ACFCYN_23150 [Gottfriedia sp. NPDC056225]|uniref:hypothetical protein n=1 Tax=Gottfriedia sp. NPDC056225 TaxID=3345751 RepID=UPI0035D5F6FF